jgi:NDP-sugar pyrophosphorylase family protein
MRGIVLVGGEGTRLRPLTLTIPKQMLPVAEVPMIERVVAHLARHGVTDVILSLGYRPDAFIAAYPDSRCAGATLTYVVEPEPLDTAGAIRFAATQARVQGTFLVFNGDVLTDLDITALVAFHREHGGDATISLTPVEEPSAFGVVPTAGDGRVEAFIEKPPPGTAPTNLINAGTYVLEPAVLERIPADRRVNIERETFPALVEDRRLYALASTGYWLDVGTPERYLTANADLLDGTRPGPPVAGARERAGGAWALPGAVVDGKVDGSLIGKDAGVAEEAIVEGAVIGQGAVVGRGAMVRRSVLLPGARIGEGAEVSESVLGPGSTVGARARVRGFSVVGAGVAVEADACHDGARLSA